MWSSCGGQHLQRATVVYCDNVSTVYPSTNLVQHQRTKHVEIDLHLLKCMSNHIFLIHLYVQFFHGLFHVRLTVYNASIFAP
jgi:hypothetical protein